MGGIWFCSNRSLYIFMALPLQLLAFFFLSLDLEFMSTLVVFLCGVPVNTPTHVKRRFMEFDLPKTTPYQRSLCFD
jgi:hypothetical protein